MQNDAGVWKRQRFELFDKDEKGDWDWETCEEQQKIINLASALGVTGKGR